MCFMKSPKVPEAQPIPEPAPAPSPVPSTTSSQTAEESRRKRLESTRYGLASTIKTGARGISGTGADLNSTSTIMGRDKLG